MHFHNIGGKNMLKKCLVIGVICLFVLVSFPIAQADTDYYSDSIVLISGKCNIVTTTGLWLFGLTYINKKEITIQAQNEDGEKIHVLIFPPNFAFYFSQENVKIKMESTEGFLFWSQKSLFFNNDSQQVFTICKSGDIWITY